MRLALRPYVTAGVAIVGASVIAATPITAAAPEIQRHLHAVTLTAATQTVDAPTPTPAAAAAAAAAAAPFAEALAVSSFVNPIARWAEVFELTAGNVVALANAVMAEPFPILRQVIANQIGYAELIGTSVSTTVQNAINLVTIYLPEIAKQVQARFAAGDIMGVGTELGNGMITVAATLFPLLDIMKIPNQIVGNLSAVVDAFTPKSFRDMGLFGQVGMGIIYAASGYVKMGAARIGQNIYDALQAGDMVKLASTIINAPADVISGILNGVYVPPRRPGGSGYWTEGLLTAKAWAPLHAFLVDLPRAIAAVIAPPTAPEAPAGADAVTDIADTTVDTDPVSMTEPAPPAEESETPAEEPTDEIASDSEEVDDTGSESSPDGSTDLSDGNKAEPGESETDATSGSDTDSAGGDEPESTSPTGADSEESDADDSTTGTTGGSDTGGAGDGGTGDGNAGGDE